MRKLDKKKERNKERLWKTKKDDEKEEKKEIT